MNGSRVILVTFVSIALLVTTLEAAHGTYKAARRAARLAPRGFRNVEVVNLASIGYNITQGCHVTEGANGVIAGRVADPIVPSLGPTSPL